MGKVCSAEDKVHPHFNSETQLRFYSRPHLPGALVTAVGNTVMKITSE